MKVLKKKFGVLLAVIIATAGVALATQPGDANAATNPLAPSSCKAVRSADGKSVKVSWTPTPKDNAARYVVERRRNLGQWYWTGRAGASSRTFTDSTLRSQDDYRIRVYTRSASGEKSGTRPCTVTRAGGTTNPNPVQNAGAVPIPRCGTYWGAYVDPVEFGQIKNSNGKLTALRRMENQIGRKYDIDHQFYRWDDFANSHNLQNYVRPSANEGRIPFLSWKGVRTNDHNVSWRAIANGSHDGLLRDKAKNIKALGVPVFITFDHEANARVGTFKPGDTGGGHVKADAGSEADYVAAWRRIVQVFDEQGATNVSWVWIMSRTPFEGDAKFADRLYPGDKYVDWIGVDPYNFNFRYNGWRTLEAQMQNFTKWVDSRNINKPWMLGEWGSVEDANRSGRKGEWYRQAGNYIQSEPRLKAAVHFESIAERDWRISSSSSSKAAFTDVGQRKHFKQNC